MKDLLKLIWFDCKLERFAEVFGDVIESEDIEHFLDVAPLTTDELQTARATHKDDFFTLGSPDHLFYVLDMATQDKLNAMRQTAGLEPVELQTAEAFFRFVNDAYLWEDVEDLRRWETELFDSLGNMEQKNFEPISDRFEGEALRSLIFFKYCHYLGGQAFDCVQIVEDDLTDSDRLGFYLGGF